jgi:hypothetical protein
MARPKKPGLGSVFFTVAYKGGLLWVYIGGIDSSFLCSYLSDTFNVGPDPIDGGGPLYAESNSPKALVW